MTVKLVNNLADLNDLDDVCYLGFDIWFNQSIDGVDYKNVTHLSLGSNFNQNIDGVDLKMSPI